MVKEKLEGNKDYKGYKERLAEEQAEIDRKREVDDNVHMFGNVPDELVPTLYKIAIAEAVLKSEDAFSVAVRLREEHGAFNEAEFIKSANIIKLYAEDRRDEVAEVGRPGTRRQGAYKFLK